MTDAVSVRQPSLGVTRGRWGRHVRSAARTLATVAVTILGLMALTFFIGRLLPLDPVLAILGDDASQEAYDKLYTQLGLDRPLPVQFASYVWDSLHLDFGQSLTSGRPVIDDIARVFPATLELATISMVMGTLIGVPMGVLAAAHQGTWIDQLLRVVSLIGYSAPNFWLGLMGLSLLYAGLGWVGGPGRIDIVYQYDLLPWSGFYLIDSARAGRWDIFGDVFSRIVLPASILAYGAMAYISRMTRSFMLEQLSQEYVTAARAKGDSRARVIWRHAFPNIAVQLVTVVALSYAFLLEGAVLTETVFAWPGFGRYLTTALLRADMNAVMGCTLVVGLIFIGLNLLSDLFYRVFDERGRGSGTHRSCRVAHQRPRIARAGAGAGGMAGSAGAGREPCRPGRAAGAAGSRGSGGAGAGSRAVRPARSGPRATPSAALVGASVRDRRPWPRHLQSGALRRGSRSTWRRSRR